MANSNSSTSPSIPPLYDSKASPRHNILSISTTIVCINNKSLTSSNSLSVFTFPIFLWMSWFIMTLCLHYGPCKDHTLWLVIMPLSLLMYMFLFISLFFPPCNLFLGKKSNNTKTNQVVFFLSCGLFHSLHFADSITWCRQFKSSLLKMLPFLLSLLQHSCESKLR